MSQGMLQAIFEWQTLICELTGMDVANASVYDGPTAAAEAMHMLTGAKRKNKVAYSAGLHPDVIATMKTYARFSKTELVEVPLAEDGRTDRAALEAALAGSAGFFAAQPNFMGCLEEMAALAELTHAAGGLLYYDGANLNAIMGVVRPGDMGFDVMHINLHKTFSTPHGGGGPGAGPVGVKKALIPFLPYPVVMEGEDGALSLDYDRRLSIGKVRGYYGSFSVLAKAYAYILSLGGRGLREASENAVLNANYVMNALRGEYAIAHDRICMHECVIAPTEEMLANGVHTTDIAKTLIDFGYHPPTIYFPLIVHEAMMIEPTESESRETLDAFIAAMKEIARIARENPEALHQTPKTTPIGRPDEVQAARKPVLRWKDGK